MELSLLEGPAAVAVRAADRVQAVLAAEPGAALILPAGATPRPLYAELVRRSRAGALDLARAHVFQLDELLGIATADARGFHAFLRRELLDRVPRAGGDHLLDGAAPDPGAEIAHHARALAERGGARLAVLGLGRNGHVGFNEPGSRADDGARVVRLAEETALLFAPAFAPDPPPRRGLTLGLAELSAARELLLLVTGAAKADVLAELLDPDPPARLPAHLLLAHPRLTVLADRAAASRLAPASTPRETR